MNRPLLVTDCDEVILHMVAPFADWLDEAHDISFEYDTGDFTRALKHRANGDYVEVEKIWPLLRSFFQTEMHRQKPIAGVLAAFAEIEKVADIVILTNIQDQERAAREAHLATLGIHYPVHTNQGGKADPMQRILDHYKPATAVFVDDLPHQIESVATGVKDVHCLHLVGEPKLAPFVKPCPHADARIDDWQMATNWIMERFEAGVSNVA